MLTPPFLPQDWPGTRCVMLCLWKNQCDAYVTLWLSSKEPKWAPCSFAWSIEPGDLYHFSYTPYVFVVKVNCSHEDLCVNECVKVVSSLSTECFRSNLLFCLKTGVRNKTWNNWRNIHVELKLKGNNFWKENTFIPFTHSMFWNTHCIETII